MDVEIHRDIMFLGSLLQKFHIERGDHAACNITADSDGIRRDFDRWQRVQERMLAMPAQRFRCRPLDPVDQIIHPPEGGQLLDPVDQGAGDKDDHRDRCEEQDDTAAVIIESGRQADNADDAEQKRAEKG